MNLSESSEKGPAAMSQPLSDQDQENVKRLVGQLYALMRDASPFTGAWELARCYGDQAYAELKQTMSQLPDWLVEGLDLQKLA